MNKVSGSELTAPNTVLEKSLDLKPYQKQRGFLIGAVVLQISLLVGLTIQPAMTMIQGRTVTFEASPVDPWDIFRGDFVNLGYSFSTDVPVSETLVEGTAVYVLLKQKPDGLWAAVRATTSKPKVETGQLIVKGKVRYSYDNSAAVSYGIERVYVPEGMGKNLAGDAHLQVEVAVDTNGEALIKELRRDGKTLSRFRLL